MPEISIIIRTKNEERWIGHCLNMIYKQTYQNFEVVLVDNNSVDHTVEIAKRYNVDTIVGIDKFFPGRALNAGIRSSTGNFIVCLSAHCVPTNERWLERLLENFDRVPNLAGAYGRQIPMSFTDPIDKRDLLIVFGQDYRIQQKDYFFHNANSILPRRIWEKFPFDEDVTNIEDRVWGKQVIDAGYCLAYDPESVVFHHHGLHQGNDVARAKGVVSILESIDYKDISNLPESMLPGQAKVAAILPIRDHVFSDPDISNLVEKSISALRQSNYISRVYIISNERLDDIYPDCMWIDRKDLPGVDELAVDELLRAALLRVEGQGFFPDWILYVNHEYYNRPDGIFDQIITEALTSGSDTVFPAYKDFGHYWYLGSNGTFLQTDNCMKNKRERIPTYRALYGVGTVTSSHFIRRGELIGDKVGILALDNIDLSSRLKRYK